jgi:predicted aspartyl protease
MTLSFRYQLKNRSTPSIPLGGRWVQPRPIIAVTFVGPGGTWVIDGLLDTGADETVLPDTAAATLGVDLTNAPTGTAMAFGQQVPVRYALVTIRLANPHERHEWQGWLAFTSAYLRWPLLGFGGFQQFFSVAYHGDREIVELTVNSLYPGT